MFKPIIDLGVTLLLWTYYIVGHVAVYTPLYLAAAVFAKDRETAAQHLNHTFFKSFFLLLRAVVPGLKFAIDPRVRQLQSAVVVSNHLSYLDPILLISLFARQKTIVKSTIFRLPIFGAYLRLSGYLPSRVDGRSAEIMYRQITGMAGFLSAGGILFVFPEGTRSRSGRLAAFNRGAFRIARRQQATISVLRIENTDRLYPPGKWLFNTCVANTVRVTHTADLTPQQVAGAASTAALMDTVRRLMLSNRSDRDPVGSSNGATR